MSGDRVSVIRRHDIPEAIRSLDPHASDYVDLFVATTRAATDSSPEDWARAAIEGAPAAGRFLAWRAALQLQLDSEPSPDRVGGWRIAGRDNSWIRLEASSWCMTAQMVFQLEDGQVSFATFMNYDRRVAALIWTPVSAIHRAVAPDFLRGAVRRVDRRRAGTASS